MIKRGSIMHIRFLIHAFLVALFVPASMFTIATEDNSYYRYPLEFFLHLLLFAVFPYWIGIKIYPYRDDCVGVKLDCRFFRLVIVIAIPLLTFFAMLCFYHEAEFFDSSMDAIIPLVFYVAVYGYFRKYWKVLFSEK